MLYILLEGRVGDVYEFLDMGKVKLLWILLRKLSMVFGGNSFLPLTHSPGRSKGRKLTKITGTHFFLFETLLVLCTPYGVKD